MSDSIPGLKKAKILCVDDEIPVLQAVERVLRPTFDTLLASNAGSALDILSKDPSIAAVITDHRMPGTTGLAFLDSASAVAPDTIRVLLSGQVDLSELVPAINSSLIHRFILKPWDNDYLLLQMHEAVASHYLLKQRRELEKLAVTDPVTLLKNHRYLQDQLRIEIDRALRHVRPLSIIMIDIDHFKAFNDQFGHPMGDLLLKSLAARLLEQVRTLDTVARYGGEEFVIILPDTPVDMALKVSERIRTAIASTPFMFGQEPGFSLTISAGVAGVPDNATSAQSLIRVADTALYRAKRQGRNQSVGASAPVT